MCWSYNRQYGTEYLAAMPTNLYGPGDYYDLNNSHVIPGLIRRMHDAKVAGAEKVVIWGTGHPRREFLYSDAAADACIFLLNLPENQFKELTQDRETAPIANIGCGDDIRISDLAKLVAEVVGFQGRLKFDTSMPDGTPQKTDGYRAASETWVESSARRSAARRFAAGVSRLSGEYCGGERPEARPVVIEIRSTEA